MPTIDTVLAQKLKELAEDGLELGDLHAEATSAESLLLHYLLDVSPGSAERPEVKKLIEQLIAAIDAESARVTESMRGAVSRLSLVTQIIRLIDRED